MYGSQFHYEQALNQKRAATEALSKKVRLEKKDKKSWMGIAFTMIILSLSVAAFAGSSQPRLAGGNGNANGH